MAASEAAKEGLYLRRFLAEFGCSTEAPTPLCVDNQAARDLAYNPEHHTRTKHIERRHFFIRETVESHELTVPFVRSADNLADFFTKPLSAAVFFPLRDAIMNIPSTAISRTGGCRKLTYASPRSSNAGTLPSAHSPVVCRSSNNPGKLSLVKQRV